jgi:nuclear distribution NudE-like protein 1
MLKEREEELLEFQESSRELEAELEAQLKSSEKRIKDLESSQERLLMENERLKERLHSQEERNRVESLRRELLEATTTNESLTERLRQLEQENDDLERGNRQLDSTLQDFQRKFDDLIEQKVFLENELDQKEGMEVVIQRLRDETRDLRQELLVKDSMMTSSRLQEDSSREKSGDVSAVATKATTVMRTGMIPLPKHRLTNASFASPPPSSKSMKPASLRKNEDDETRTSMTFKVASKSCRTTCLPSSGIPSPQEGVVLSPTTRSSALNIVSDLLRKVGALEYKLASCRNPLPSPVKEVTSPSYETLLKMYREREASSGTPPRGSNGLADHEVIANQSRLPSPRVKKTPTSTSAVNNNNHHLNNNKHVNNK